MHMLHFFQKTWEGLKRNQSYGQFLVLASFLATFAITRLVTHLQRADYVPNQGVDFHIHHMVVGIFLLIISGYLGLSFWNSEMMRHAMSVLFGIGAALAIDEFALWLFLRDVYWQKEGRHSIDAIIITTILLTLGFLISEAHDHGWLKKKISHDTL